MVEIYGENDKWKNRERMDDCLCFIKVQSSNSKSQNIDTSNYQNTSIYYYSQFRVGIATKCCLYMIAVFSVLSIIIFVW